MKYVSIITTIAGMLLLNTIPGNLQAQKPEPIYSFATVQKPVSWYKEQRTAWKREITKNSKNAFAWYNYYRVNRNLAHRDTTDNRSQQEKWDALKDIVADMEKKVPNSYEYNLCKWMTGGNDFKFLPYLKKANELGKSRIEHLSDMIVWAEGERDTKRRDEYALKWYQSGTYSPGLLAYSYNVVSGLKPNSILISCGDNDTYPVWILQSLGIRKDITLINSSLILIDTYREKLFRELGLEPWNIDMTSATSMETFKKEITKRLAANNKKYPVYVALTTGTEYTEKNEDKLYLTGLAYEYSTEQIDNMALLKKNFEQVYELNYIEHYFYRDISEEVMKCTSANYVVPLFKLYEHYKSAGDNDKAIRCKQLIRAAAKGNYPEKEVEKYFETN